MMQQRRLPNAERALVPRQKLTDYLLSSSHPVGKAKAAFFRAEGFDSAAWPLLADALRRHAEGCPLAKTEETAFGTRYTVEGPLETPTGDAAPIRSVWFIEEGEAVPRLVTAYPLPGRREE